MGEEDSAEWITLPKNKQVLEAFLIPKTPSQIQTELNINKINLKPFLQRGLIKCLNPQTHKGRLYILTEKSRKLLNVEYPNKYEKVNYDLIGWILASPKQRYVMLKILGRDSIKRTSEDLRKRSSSSNPCFSRISTKAILKELMNQSLADSEMGDDRRRYYWITEKGKNIKREIDMSEDSIIMG